MVTGQHRVHHSHRGQVGLHVPFARRRAECGREPHDLHAGLGHGARGLRNGLGHGRCGVHVDGQDAPGGSFGWPGIGWHDDAGLHPAGEREAARGGGVGRDLVRDAGSVRSGDRGGLTVLVGVLELALGGDEVAQGAQAGPDEPRERAGGLKTSSRASTRETSAAGMNAPIARGSRRRGRRTRRGGCPWRPRGTFTLERRISR